MSKVHKVRLGEELCLGPSHTMVIYYADVGRWATELYVREDDQGLRVRRVISIFNRDIMVMGDVIHLKGEDLSDILR